MAIPNLAWHYWAYGCPIQSEIPVPIFLPGSAVADASPTRQAVVISRSSSGMIEAHIPPEVAQQPIAIHTQDQTITLYIRGIAAFVIEQGAQITCYLSPTATDRTVSLALSGTAMAALLFQRDCFIAHGSAVSLDGKAAIFLGDSGAGKSSVAIALHQQGYPIITDDLIAITYIQGRPYLLPAFPQTRVTQETAAALGLKWSSLIELSTAHKRGFRFEHRFITAPIPVQQIYVLRRSTEALTIRPLERHEKMMELMHHSEVMSLFYPEKTPHFLACARLAQTVPIHYFERPMEWSELPRVLDYFQQHWSAQSHLSYSDGEVAQS